MEPMKTVSAHKETKLTKTGLKAFREHFPELFMSLRLLEIFLQDI